MVKTPLAIQETRVWSWVRKIHWRREWQPTPVFLLGEFCRQRNLVDYSPWVCKESNTTERPTHSLWQWLYLSLWNSTDHGLSWAMTYLKTVPTPHFWIPQNGLRGSLSFCIAPSFICLFIYKMYFVPVMCKHCAGQWWCSDEQDTIPAIHKLSQYNERCREVNSKCWDWGRLPGGCDVWRTTKGNSSGRKGGAIVIAHGRSTGCDMYKDMAVRGSWNVSMILGLIG